MKNINKKFLLLLIIIILLLGIILIISQKTNKKNQTITKTEEISCKKAGCSGNLCVESSKEDMITTCEWKEEYGCYQKAKCERQKDGNCGFTNNEEFDTCINKLMPKKKIY